MSLSWTLGAAELNSKPYLQRNLFQVCSIRSNAKAQKILYATNKTIGTFFDKQNMNPHTKIH